jgi:hypothetical protein
VLQYQEICVQHLLDQELGSDAAGELVHSTWLFFASSTLQIHFRPRAFLLRFSFVFSLSYHLFLNSVSRVQVLAVEQLLFAESLLT